MHRKIKDTDPSEENKDLKVSGGMLLESGNIANPVLTEKAKDAERARGDEKAAGAEGSKYMLKEFASNVTAVFGKNISPDCVVAAFKINNRQEATVSEAREMVNAFITKEVE